MSKKQRKEITGLLKMQIDSYCNGRQKETDLILTIVELKYTLKSILKGGSEVFIYNIPHPLIRR